MSGPIIMEIGVWRFVWGGGRLADVYHLESYTALDCIQVGNYDFSTDKHTHAGTRSLEAAAKRWVKDDSDVFLRELPYLL